jgi:hypothetical protein
MSVNTRYVSHLANVLPKRALSPYRYHERYLGLSIEFSYKGSHDHLESALV